MLWGVSAKTRGWSISWDIDGQLRGPAAQLGDGNVSGEPFPRALFHFFFFRFFFILSQPRGAAFAPGRLRPRWRRGAFCQARVGLWPAGCLLLKMR